MMTKKRLRVVAVEYYNTLPFIRAIKNTPDLGNLIDLKTADPKGCALALRDGTADLSLLPVGSMPDFDRLHLAVPFGIGSDGAVHTVGIFSDAGMEDITVIRTSPASRTSNQLVRVLNKILWDGRKEFITPESPEKEDASLIIGDEAFTAHEHYRHAYDLGLLWKNATTKPFVFATWVSREPLEKHFKKSLFDAFEHHTKVSALGRLAGEMQGRLADPESYYLQNIRFRITPEYLEGMKLFFELNGWVWNLEDLSTY